MDTFRGKSVLVTGAAGFVGSHMVRRLCAEGAQVHALVRPHTDRQRLADVIDQFAVHEVDMTDDAAVAQVLAASAPNGVFHFAGASQAFGAVPSTDHLIDVNIRASVRLMEMLQEYSYDFFVNTSTFVEVGKQSAPLREDMPMEPTEFYGISRLPALLYARALGRAGKPTTTVRVFTPYGPFLQRGKLLYMMITHALRNEPIALTRKSVTRDFIFIDDLIDLYLAVARGSQTHPGEVFNGGSGKATTLADLASLVIRLADSQSTVSWQDAGVSYDEGHWEADTTKVRSVLGWKPHYSLENGITATIDWFRAHEDYWRSDT